MQTLTKPTKEEILYHLVAKNRQVIYGQRATNFHLPINLRKSTTDYDILTSKAKRSAEELKESLNKYYNKKYEVVEAKHKGTYKVKDKGTGKTFADFTQTTKKPQSYNQLGIRYASINYSKKKLDKSSKIPYRREKDLDTLNRIKYGKKKGIFR